MQQAAEVTSAIPTKEVPCLLCGRSDPSVMFSEGPWRIVKCRGCRLVYTLPRLSPEQIKAMYQTAYWQSDRAKDFGYTDYIADRELYVATYRMRREVITSRKATPGRVLDVGSAAGYFLSVMKEIGWDCHGIELSEFMAAKSREMFGLANVKSGSLLDSTLPEKSFDVVTFWDVIEHLEDPVPHLKKAASLLKDDGILVIETQNVESRAAKLLGKRWQHYKFAEHLWHFAPETAKTLLDRAGLKILENTPKRGGKKVTFNFIRERVGKIHPVLSVLASPLKLIGKRSLYVNLFDEMLIVAEKARG